MGWNDHIDEEKQALNEFLKERIRHGGMSNAAVGIAKLVKDKGSDSLSSKQNYIFEHEVLGRYANLRCRFCDSEIPIDEAIFAVEENKELCLHCSRVLDEEK